jgi:glycosyltransferase involved in cell wall biosynthesis
MRKEPKVTIIIPALDEEKNIPALLDSISNLDYSNYKIIIVVDPATTDNTYEILREIKNSKLSAYLGPKKGSAALRNLAYKKSDKDTEYYAFTDSDCIVDKNWLKILVRTMDRAPSSVVCVGGINLAPSKDSEKSKLFTKIEQTLIGAGGTAQTKTFKKVTEVDSIPNCNALYKKEVWENYLQDERLIKGQDGEFNIRIHNDGGKFLINPKAIVWHRRLSKLKKQLKRYFWYGEATAKIIKKHKWSSKILIKRWYGLLPTLYYIAIPLLLLLSIFSQKIFGIFLVGVLSYLFVILLTTLQVYFSLGKIKALNTIWIIPAQHANYAYGMMKELLK